MPLARKLRRMAGANARLMKSPGDARASSASARRARIPAAVLHAAADDPSSTRVAFALADALASLPGVARAVVARSVAEVEALELVAISGQARIDPRRAANARLLAACEAVRKLAPDARGLAVRAPSVAVHDGLGGCVALSIEPAERDVDIPELEATARSARDACRLLLVRARDERTGRRRVADAWRSACAADGMAGRLATRAHAILPRAIGQRVTPRRAAVAALALAIVALGCVPVPVIVKARATLEAENLQVVSAAEDGHLVAAAARPGDRVAAGQVLARLDDRQPALELAAGRSEAARNDEELARATATRDRAALGELRAVGRRIAADVADAERRLARTALRAPFEAVVLKGDPTRRLGAPVAAGEVLFELGSADAHRLVLNVDEHDVRLMRAGQRARIRFAGAPGRTWDARLGELLPVAAAEPGSGTFRVPAALERVEDAPRHALRSGMRGVARVRTGSAPLALAWTRTLRDRALLLAWRAGLVP